jgi:hypothetical protein
VNRITEVEYLLLDPDQPQDLTGLILTYEYGGKRVFTNREQMRTVLAITGVAHGLNPHYYEFFPDTNPADLDPDVLEAVLHTMPTALGINVR